MAKTFYEKNINEHYNKEYLRKAYGSDTNADIWRFSLENIMHPQKNNILKICLVSTKTCLGNIDCIDAILTEVIKCIKNYGSSLILGKSPQ